VISRRQKKVLLLQSLDTTETRDKHLIWFLSADVLVTI